MAQNEIKILFKGDNKNLVKAINELDKVTKSLLNTQAKIEQFNKRTTHRTNAVKDANRRLYLEIKKNGIKSFKDLGLQTGVLTRAFQGNRSAIRKVRAEMQKLAIQNGTVKKGILDTEHGTRILGGSFAVLRSKMLLASFGAGLFGASVGRLTNLFGEQEKAEKKLETAIGRHSSALLAFASAQQKVTTFGDEETITAMSLLGAYTDNEKAIARLTDASMDLASAKGMDLNSAVDLVSKSVFSSTNALSRYGIEIEGTKGSVQRLESATSAISKLYEGQAKASAETFLGSMTQLSNSVGDLGERFGSILAPAVVFSAKGIKAFADSIDTEEIKAYGSALIGVTGVYIIATKGTLMLSKAMIALNKVSKKNIAIFAGMIAIGALIDKFNLFADATGDVSDEIKELEGALGSLNAKAGVSKEINLALLASQMSLGTANKQLHPLYEQEERLLNELALLKKKYGIEGELTNEVLISNAELGTEHNKILEKKLGITTAISDAETKAKVQLIGDMATLNNAVKGNSLVSARLAQAQAIISAYTGANKAFEQGGVLGFLTGASILATGLANVAVISREISNMKKFESGGLVGGRRHSQGGTIIEAEQGEFVMSRNAVKTIGVGALNEMNASGSIGSTINVNINGNMIGNEEFVRDTLIPEISKTVRQGLA